MTMPSRQSKPEEVVMAGDGGRVPDVSEQRAYERCATCGLHYDEDSAGAECSRLEADLLDIHDALADPDEPSAINAAWIIERIEALRSPSDPASVLAALLAESPETTVAAIEALLTTDGAVDGLIWESPYGLQRHTARRMLGRACRSLLSKAPKGDGDA